MPPSTSLSTLIATATYLSVVTTINVQITSDSTPSTAAGSGAPPVTPRTVLSVLKRARPDIAEYNPQGGQTERRQAAADGGARYSFADFRHRMTALRTFMSCASI